MDCQLIADYAGTTQHLHSWRYHGRHNTSVMGTRGLGSLSDINGVVDNIAKTHKAMRW